MRLRFVPLTLSALLVLAVLILAPSPAQAQTGKIYGLVTDEEGNPLVAVKIHLKDAETGAILRPAKSKKTGKFLYMAPVGNYYMWPELEGYLLVQQKVISVNPAGQESVQTHFFDEEQKIDKQFHIYPTGDITSKTSNRIEFIMTPPDGFIKVANRLYAEHRGVDPEADAEAEPEPEVEERTSFDQALDFLASQNWAGAYPLLVAASSEDPNNPDVHYQLGKAAMEMENFAAAEPALVKAKDLDPTKPGVHFHLARLYNNKGMKAEAVQALESELDLTPDSLAVKENLGILYSETGQSEKAVALFESLIEENPENFEAYVALANLYKAMGDRAKEEEVYKQMGDKDPTGRSLFNLGQLAFNRDERDKAKFYYERVIEKNPKHGMAHYQLANVLLAQGDIKGAVEHFEAFVKYSPKDPKAKEAKQTAAALKEMLG